MLRSVINGLMTLGAGAPATSLAQDAASEAPIRAIVAEQVSAWNSGDGQAYAQHLAPDASFTNLFGMVMYGAPAFAKRHTDILATFYKGTTKHHDIRRIRFVTPGVAIVDIDNEVRGVKAMPGGVVMPPNDIVKTQLMEVFVRRAGDGGSKPTITRTSSLRSDRSVMGRLELATQSRSIRSRTNDQPHNVEGSGRSGCDGLANSTPLIAVSQSRSPGHLPESPFVQHITRIRGEYSRLVACARAADFFRSRASRVRRLRYL